MCNEPLNPNLPHWRRPKEEPLKGVKAEALTGENREAALRAQTVADKAFKDGQMPEFTATEGDDWAIYGRYWDAVSRELIVAVEGVAFVSAHDVTEEVRKRLSEVQDGNDQ